MPLVHARSRSRRRSGDAAERARIDAFVRAHPDATPFHLPGWSVAVARGCGQTAHYLVAERADGAIVGVLPLTEMRSPLFGTALVSAGFAVDGGILADDATRSRALADAAWALAEQLGCPASNCAAAPAPGAGWHRRRRRPISASRAIWRPTTRPNCSRSRASSAPRCASRSTTTCEVAIGNAPSDRAMHYARLCRSRSATSARRSFPRALFREVLDEFGDRRRHPDRPPSTARAVASVLSLYLQRHRLSLLGRRHARRAGAARQRPDVFRADAPCARARLHALRFRPVEGGHRGGGVQEELGLRGRAAAPMHKRVADGATPREVNPLDPKYALQGRGCGRSCRCRSPT